MPAVRTVLIVDGDAVLRQSLAEQLERDGEFACRHAGAGMAALEVAQRKPLDAVLVGERLADMAVPQLCEGLRRHGVTGPIVVLAAPDSGAELRRALAAGASGHVTKPFRLNDLLARLRAEPGPMAAAEGTVVTIGPYAFEPNARLLSENDGCRQVRLTDKEAAILKFLYRAGGAIGREMLLGAVWGYNAGVTTHTVETHVYRLRRKIERDPAKAEILVTEPGGYRLLP